MAGGGQATGGSVSAASVVGAWGCVKCPPCRLYRRRAQSGSRCAVAATGQKRVHSSPPKSAQSPNLANSGNLRDQGRTFSFADAPSGCPTGFASLHPPLPSTRPHAWRPRVAQQRPTRRSQSPPSRRLTLLVFFFLFVLVLHHGHDCRPGVPARVQRGHVLRLVGVAGRVWEPPRLSFVFAEVCCSRDVTRPLMLGALATWVVSCVGYTPAAQRQGGRGRKR